MTEIDKPSIMELLKEVKKNQDLICNQIHSSDITAAHRIENLEKLFKLMETYKIESYTLGSAKVTRESLKLTQGENSIRREEIQAKREALKG